jgi:hypothetical protein
MATLLYGGCMSAISRLDHATLFIGCSKVVTPFPLFVFNHCVYCAIDGGCGCYCSEHGGSGLRLELNVMRIVLCRRLLGVLRRGRGGLATPNLGIP